jgi:hypothetical protein
LVAAVVVVVVVIHSEVSVDLVAYLVVWVEVVELVDVKEMISLIHLSK